MDLKKPLLIGLTGYATAGKDAFADHLVADFGYVKLGWADALYELALDLNPCIWRTWRSVELVDLVDDIGWTEAKKIPYVREFLQDLGTNVRNRVGKDAWVNALLPKIKELLRAKKNVVITNTRFKNEARAIIELGGTIVLVTRPGVGPVNNHVSDKGEAFEWASCEVINGDSLQHLRKHASDIHTSLLAEKNGDVGEAALPSLYVAMMQDTIARSVSTCIKSIISIAAPEEVDVEDYVKRHRVQVVSGDDGATIVTVDGEVAGEVLYEDGVVTMDAYVAR